MTARREPVMFREITIRPHFNHGSLAGVGHVGDLIAVLLERPGETEEHRARMRPQIMLARAGLARLGYDYDQILSYTRGVPWIEKGKAVGATREQARELEALLRLVGPLTAGKWRQVSCSGNALMKHRDARQEAARRLLRAAEPRTAEPESEYQQAEEEDGD